MKIISWNVAGLRACLKKGFEDFFNNEKPEIICLQETKLLDKELEFKPAGYDYYLFPADKKGYSGTLVYTKVKPISVKFGLNIEEYDIEGRTITLEFDDFYLINVYVPNVKRDLSRMESRMNYEDIFRKYINNLSKTKNVVVCGDFNVAHTEIDIKNPKSNIRSAGFTIEERNKMTELLNSGFIDTYRYFNPDELDCYTWWSYMRNARDKNIGWRLDYFLVNNKFIDSIKKSIIYKDILGSDHCPIGIEINNKKTC